MTTTKGHQMTTTTQTEQTTLVMVRGAQMRRRQRGAEVIWQAASADPTWGYWYSTARQARAGSNASDRVLA
jgi:hypothetical protein